jgi:PleD family two-component response regulator
LKVTASIGVTKLKANDNIPSLIKRVDIALHEAKNSGKNKVVIMDN